MGLVSRMDMLASIVALCFDDVLLDCPFITHLASSGIRIGLFHPSI